MFDNKNHYKLVSETSLTGTHYFVCFEDIFCQYQQIEVSEEVYYEFEQFVRYERKLRRRDERNEEHLALTDEALNRQKSRDSLSIEEYLEQRELITDVQRAIQALPEIQRRRFLLYHEHGLTYKQIAETENCSLRAVEYSIEKAQSNLSKIFF